ncbi:UDP-forming cellulose synthase catalytic subunit, partial [Erwinia sp. MYb416]
MNPLRWLLIPPVWQALHQRYRDYRRHRAPVLTAALQCLLVMLGWTLLRFESPEWQSVRVRRRQLYPQISPERPRPADLLRYLVQSLWLVLFMPNDASPRSERLRLNAFRPLALRRKLFHRWLHRLSQKAQRSRL